MLTIMNRVLVTGANGQLGQELKLKIESSHAATDIGDFLFVAKDSFDIQIMS